MKVLFVRRHLDRAEFDMVMSMYQRGIHIRVLTESTSKYRQQLEQAGIYIQALPYSSKIAPRFILQVRRTLRQGGFDIVHTTDSKSIANVVWASYFLPVKIIAYRGTLAKIRRYDISYWMAILNPKIDRVVCVNRSIYEYMHQFFPAEKLLLNYKGYDPEWEDGIGEAEEDFKVSCQGRFVVVSIATTRGRPHKGLPQLMEAAGLMAIPNLLLVHIGNYDDDAPLMAAKGINAGRIMLLGDRLNASRYLELADVYVLPSLRDGMPRAVKEAMARALPVVSTNIPGPTDMVVDGQTGLLVTPGSPQAIADAVTRLYQDPVLRQKLGEGGKQYLLENFSPESFVEKTVALYEDLMASG